MNITDRETVWTFYEQPEKTIFGFKIASTEDCILYQNNSEFRIYDLSLGFEIIGHGCVTLGDCMVYIEALSGRKDGHFYREVMKQIWPDMARYGQGNT